MKIQIHSFTYSIFHAINSPWTLILLGIVEAAEDGMTNKTQAVFARHQRLPGEWRRQNCRQVIKLRVKDAVSEESTILNWTGGKLSHFQEWCRGVFHEKVV